MAFILMKQNRQQSSKIPLGEQERWVQIWKNGWSNLRVAAFFETNLYIGTA